MGQLLNREIPVDVFGQPLERDVHQPAPRNWSNSTQESHIVAVEVTDVADAVTKHRDSLDAHTKRETGVSLGIQSGIGDDLRVDHAATENLEPVALPTDAEFRAGLDEGEVVAAETGFDLSAEYTSDKRFQRALEVGE